MCKIQSKDTHKHMYDIHKICRWYAFCWWIFSLVDYKLLLPPAPVPHLRFAIHRKWYEFLFINEFFMNHFHGYVEGGEIALERAHDQAWRSENSIVELFHLFLTVDTSRGGAKVTVLRLCTVYGPRTRTHSHTQNAKINRLAEMKKETDGDSDWWKRETTQRNETIKNYCPFSHCAWSL